MRTASDPRAAGRARRGGAKGVMALALPVLLALPGVPSAGGAEEAAPAWRRHVLSAGFGATVGVLGARYTCRLHESGLAASAGAGLFGYSLALGLPVHRDRSRPTRELVVYGSVMQWQFPGALDLSDFDIDEGSHLWVLGLGPRVWPDQAGRMYAAAAGELLLSTDRRGRPGFSLELGYGF